jgi:ArsR family transcriptional regulator
VVDSTAVDVKWTDGVSASVGHGATSVSLLAAVADPVRWSVLQRLAGAPSCVCDLQEHVPVAANLLSYHLKVLRGAGLVTTSRRGRWVDYALADDAFERLVAALPGSGRVGVSS